MAENIKEAIKAHLELLSEEELRILYQLIRHLAKKE